MATTVSVSKILCLLAVLMTISKGQGARVVHLPIKCELVLCAVPDCPYPIPPKPGQCCPTCPEDPTPPSPPLKCPKLPPDTFGLCVERCSADDDCPKGELCCFNGCGHDCTPGVPIHGVCKFKGKVYRAGDTFPAGDGCNKCTCLSSGRVVCTKIACPEVCVRDGVTYNVGDSFPAGDGCNTCTCLSGGWIACTKIACPEGCVRDGVTYKVGESFPAGDGCNTCSCIRPNKIVCTLIACPAPTTPPPPNSCPPEELVNCFVDPCMFAECSAHPTAKCVADYCGGCNARFFLNGLEVTDTCQGYVI